ncbi:MAG: hypothetical protein Q7S68_05260, partial [Deltaproteobacteria bacterium]|nr:hypothetical protein [Deltaproteobacteria bacterium]
MPENAVASNRFRERFNDVAKELQIGLQWVEDKKDPLAVNAEELRVAADQLKKYEGAGNTPKIFSPELEADVRKILQKVEEERLSAVEKSALQHKRIPYRAPFENLNKAEQKAVVLFETEAKPIVDRIVARQEDPTAPALAGWMVYHGDYYSKILFSRFHKDVCAGSFGKDKTCSLAPFFPDPPAISGMIGPGISL